MNNRWTAVVLAGDRGHSDPVRLSAGSSCKAMAQLAGRSMLETVLIALRDSRSVGSINVVGPQLDCYETDSRLDQLHTEYGFRYIEPEAGPSASALRAVTQIDRYPILLLTCDLPMVNAEAIDQFCEQVEPIQADIVAAYVKLSAISKLMPQMQKTAYRSAGTKICFTNLFGLLHGQACNALQFWHSIETQRKNPLAVLRSLGWSNVIRYRLGWFDVANSSEMLSSRLNCRAQLEEVSNPRMAIDVDSASDYELLQQYYTG